MRVSEKKNFTLSNQNLLIYDKKKLFCVIFFLFLKIHSRAKNNFFCKFNLFICIKNFLRNSFKLILVRRKKFFLLIKIFSA